MNDKTKCKKEFSSWRNDRRIGDEVVLGGEVYTIVSLNFKR